GTTWVRDQDLHSSQIDGAILKARALGARDAERLSLKWRVVGIVSVRSGAGSSSAPRARITYLDRFNRATSSRSTGGKRTRRAARPSQRVQPPSIVTVSPVI